MLPGVYIVLSPQEEEVYFSSWGHRCTHSAPHSLKRFKPLSPIILLCQGYCRIEKNTKYSLMVLIIKPGSTLKFQLVFVFNECLWATFPLLSFETFWIFMFGLWLYDFRFYDTNGFTSSHLLHYHSCPWTKSLSAKTTKYIPKCWEKSVKRSSKLNSIRVINNSYWDQYFLYICRHIWSIPFSKFFGDNFLSLAQNVSSSAVQFYCNTWNISILSMIV